MCLCVCVCVCACVRVFVRECVYVCVCLSLGGSVPASSYQVQFDPIREWWKRSNVRVGGKESVS